MMLTALEGSGVYATYGLACTFTWYADRFGLMQKAKYGTVPLVPISILATCKTPPLLDWP